MRKIYRAGAIGRTGGGGFGHGLHRAYKNLENAEMIAVADENAEGREKAIHDSGAQRGYADYLKMLEKEDLDIVSVCPRHLDQRLEMVLACVEAKCHVHCEKPFAISLEDGDRMVETADRNGVKIAVGHFHGTYMIGAWELKQEIENGRIGQLMSMHAHGKHDKRGGGEDAMDLGTHLFNLMCYLAGEPDWMSAHVMLDGRAIRPEDVHEATEPLGPVVGDWIDSYYAFKNGVVGFFDSRRNQPGVNDRYGMEIVGDNGMISLRGQTIENLMVYPHPLWHPADTSRVWEPMKLKNVPALTGHEIALMDLIKAIEEDRDPICSGHDGTTALEMVMGIYESQITGERVNCPMKNRQHPLINFQKKGGI